MERMGQAICLALDTGRELAKGTKHWLKRTLSDHAKSTATSAEDDSTKFIKSQVAVMIKAHVAAE